MPSTLIDDLETFDFKSLANWIDYVEQCILKLNIAEQYRFSMVDDICSLNLSSPQADALNRLLLLSLNEQYAVIRVAKVMCRAMNKSSK